MSINIIESKLKNYDISNKQEELNAIKEIFQEIALAALSRSNFFKEAAFQGGTCLRIVHGMRRFSEDLDFILMQPTIAFTWENVLQTLQNEFFAYDIEIEATDRSKVGKPIKTAFIKYDSLGKIISLTYKRDRSDIQTIQIKLEIDSHPPEGSIFEKKMLDFPFPYTITTQDLSSLFASKCHALLYRPYMKGRDWYDFVWYVSRKTPMNFDFLQNAIRQSEKNPRHLINRELFIEKIKNKIKETDWDEAKQDVIKFLKPNEIQSLNMWNASFFKHYMERLNEYLKLPI